MCARDTGRNESLRWEWGRGTWTTLWWNSLWEYELEFLKGWQCTNSLSLWYLAPVPTMPCIPHPILMLISTQNWSEGVRTRLFCSVPTGGETGQISAYSWHGKKKIKWPCSFDCFSQPMLLVTLALLGWDVLLVLLSLGFGSSPDVVLRSLLPQPQRTGCLDSLIRTTKGCKDVFLWSLWDLVLCISSEFYERLHSLFATQWETTPPHTGFRTSTDCFPEFHAT